MLNGSASWDADGDSLTYSWTLLGPDGSRALLEGSNGASPSFVADVPGAYTAVLSVNDGRLGSSSSTQILAVPDRGENPAYRVGVASRAQRSRPDGLHVLPLKDWVLEYAFLVPPLPSGEGWSPSRGVFYLWGDVDFDAYGSRAPEASARISGYRFNQIVPQLVVGHVLSGNDEQFRPTWTYESTWKVQAQYFWQSEDGSLYAQTGPLVNAMPGELVRTRISYSQDSGSITATIQGPQGTSEVVVPKPFPNDPALFSSWANFFDRASSSLGENFIRANPVMNLETYFVDAPTLCQVLPWRVRWMSLPGLTTGSSSFESFTYDGLECAQELTRLEF